MGSKVILTPTALFKSNRQYRLNDIDRTQRRHALNKIEHRSTKHQVVRFRTCLKCDTTLMRMNPIGIMRGLIQQVGIE